MHTPAYIQHTDKAAETDSRFSHVMAITLDPTAHYKQGVIRCVLSRDGDIEILGYIDRSALHLVTEDAPGHFTIGERLIIENEDKIVAELNDEELDYLGLEDPDIWIDETTGLMHLYFTMPFISRDKKKRHSLVYLGHAVGKDLHSLRMTMPVLKGDPSSYEDAHAKEVVIVPVNSKGIRLNLFEGHDKTSSDSDTSSTVRVAVAKDMNGPWEFGPTVLHPKDSDFAWIGAHASPGPLFPKSFIDIGKNKLVGVMNGREVGTHVGKQTRYGDFSIGLYVYDYEQGVIDWVSPEPFIKDTEAKTITFASQFVETGPGRGILYAHVDDSFVRAYDLDARAIESGLPQGEEVEN